MDPQDAPDWLLKIAADNKLLTPAARKEVERRYFECREELKHYRQIVFTLAEAHALLGKYLIA
jgi:hypothetical protein